MKKIGFIGAGNMAGAILNGVITTGTYPAEQLFVFDVSQEKCNAMGEKGIGSFSSAAELVANCDVIFLSIKPQEFYRGFRICPRIRNRGQAVCYHCCRNFHHIYQRNRTM